MKTGLVASVVCFVVGTVSAYGHGPEAQRANPYDVLHLGRDAGPDLLRRAYRNEVWKLELQGESAGGGTTEAPASAYQLLTDAEERRRFDLYGGAPAADDTFEDIAAPAAQVRNLLARSAQFDSETVVRLLFFCGSRASRPGYGEALLQALRDPREAVLAAAAEAASHRPQLIRNFLENNDPKVRLEGVKAASRQVKSSSWIRNKLKRMLRADPVEEVRVAAVQSLGRGKEKGNGIEDTLAQVIMDKIDRQAVIIAALQALHRLKARGVLAKQAYHFGATDTVVPIKRAALAVASELNAFRLGELGKLVSGPAAHANAFTLGSASVHGFLQVITHTTLDEIIFSGARGLTLNIDRIGDVRLSFDEQSLLRGLLQHHSAEIRIAAALALDKASNLDLEAGGEIAEAYLKAPRSSLEKRALLKIVSRFEILPVSLNTSEADPERLSRIIHLLVVAVKMSPKKKDEGVETLLTELSTHRAKPVRTAALRGLQILRYRPPTSGRVVRLVRSEAELVLSALRGGGKPCEEATERAGEIGLDNHEIDTALVEVANRKVSANSRPQIRALRSLLKRNPPPEIIDDRFYDLVEKSPNDRIRRMSLRNLFKYRSEEAKLATFAFRLLAENSELTNLIVEEYPWESLPAALSSMSPKARAEVSHNLCEAIVKIPNVPKRILSLKIQVAKDWLKPSDSDVQLLEKAFVKDRSQTNINAIGTLLVLFAPRSSESRRALHRIGTHSNTEVAHYGGRFLTYWEDSQRTTLNRVAGRKPKVMLVVSKTEPDSSDEVEANFRVLKKGKPEKRRAAAEALGRMTRRKGEIVSVLLQAIEEEKARDDRDEAVRGEALIAVGKLRRNFGATTTHRETIRHQVEMLMEISRDLDENDWIRGEAARAVLYIDFPDAELNSEAEDTSAKFPERLAPDNCSIVIGTRAKALKAKKRKK